MKILEKVNNPKDLKKLNINELNSLSGEVRELLIKTVSENGGHLASNLGVTELTISLLKSFNLPEDKIVYDVGHQTYVHKILTGRREAMSTLRKFGGISGFPKPSESEFDSYETGHGGTAISVAYAIAEANKLNNNNNFAIAVVGDACLANGLSFEGLNNAGRSNTRLIVVLNDNQMSISGNVGNLRNYLSKLRTKPEYTDLKGYIARGLLKLPVAGNKITKIIKKTKFGIKHMIIPGTLFEELGFTYIGPIDGHNIELMNEVFEGVKATNQPVLVHVITKKGKGYPFAEKAPYLYHGTGSFDKTKPLKFEHNENSYSEIAGKKLLELGKENENIVAICAAMEDGTGLYRFHREFPKRFFDVGISEEHAVTFSGGLAKMGKIPVTGVYSTFLQRCYDNIIHDVSLGNRHCVFLIDRGGITGPDGETHQGIFDVPMLLSIPNAEIFTPYTKNELEFAIEYAVNKTSCPTFVRYPKGNAPSGDKVSDIFAPVVLREGENATVITFSQMTGIVQKAEFNGDHIHLNCITTVDYEFILKSASKTKKVFVFEDNILNGGFGQKLSSKLACMGYKGEFKAFGIEGFVEHGSIKELLKKYGLDEESITKRINE